MADVFISYAREDRARAEQIARGLEAQGYDVFWDNEIPPGQTWADYTEAKLTQSKVTVVLWTASSVASQWVREEARMGRDKGVLIPVMIDASQPPFGFGEVQAANLANWNGEADNPNWRRFIDAVMRVTQAEPRPVAPPPAPQPQPAPQQPPQQAWSTPQPQQQPAAGEKKGVPTWAWIAGGAVGVALLVGVAGSMMSQQPQQQAAYTQPQQPPQSPQQQPVGDQNPQQIIVAQLQQAQGVLAQEGFQQVGQPFSGGLQPGQTWDLPTQMGVGYEYRIVGVCDRDCADLDIRLFDGNGALIVEDTSTSSQPVVGVIPTSSGMFNVQVHMYACTVAPCYYAVALYARPQQ